MKHLSWINNNDYFKLFYPTAPVKRKYEGVRKRWKEEEKDNFDELHLTNNKRKSKTFKGECKANNKIILVYMLSVHLSSDNLRSLPITQTWCWTLSPHTGTNLQMNIIMSEESNCSEDDDHACVTMAFSVSIIGL